MFKMWYKQNLSRIKFFSEKFNIFVPESLQIFIPTNSIIYNWLFMSPTLQS